MILVQGTKKILMLLVLSFIAFTLTGCGINYHEFDGEIDGHQVYEYEQFGVHIECDKISGWDVFIVDGDDIYVVKGAGINSCNSTLYIKDFGAFISLSEALEQGILELDDILNHNWDFVIYKSSNPFKGLEIDKIIVTDEVNYSEDIIIDEESIIMDIVIEFNYSYTGFISGYDYGDEEVLSYIEVYDVHENIYHFELRTNGLLFVDENTFSDYYSNYFHEILN